MVKKAEEPDHWPPWHKIWSIHKTKTEQGPFKASFKKEKKKRKRNRKFFIFIKVLNSLPITNACFPWNQCVIHGTGHWWAKHSEKVAPEPVLIKDIFKEYSEELSATQMLHQQSERKKKSEYSFVSKSKTKRKLKSKHGFSDRLLETFYSSISGTQV